MGKNEAVIVHSSSVFSMSAVAFFFTLILPSHFYLKAVGLYNNI